MSVLREDRTTGELRRDYIIICDPGMLVVFQIPSQSQGTHIRGDFLYMQAGAFQQALLTDDVFDVLT